MCDLYSILLALFVMIIYYICDCYGDEYDFGDACDLSKGSPKPVGGRIPCGGIDCLNPNLCLGCWEENYYQIMCPWKNMNAQCPNGQSIHRIMVLLGPIHTGEVFQRISVQ